METFFKSQVVRKYLYFPYSVISYANKISLSADRFIFCVVLANVSWRSIEANPLRKVVLSGSPLAKQTLSVKHLERTNFLETVLVNFKWSRYQQHDLSFHCCSTLRTQYFRLSFISFKALITNLFLYQFSEYKKSYFLRRDNEMYLHIKKCYSLSKTSVCIQLQGNMNAI